MQDRAFRMFTWVYLSAFKELDPNALIRTHIEKMDQIGFEAEMCKYILESFENNASIDLKFKYLSKLAYSKLIDN